ncbi:hypothetical protein [Winogradskyella sp.]|uniref:hypothetical protein n=1 Tax=Winogradskyella sp. TaxID=1883156 RepID=UPI003AB16851
MKKVVIILPRGEAIKNFVYTGITDVLRKEYKIIFFSVVPNLELKDYLIGKCDEFHELKASNTQNRYANQVKKILDLAHGKQLNSVTGNLKIVKDDLISKRNKKTRLSRIGRKIVASFFTTHKGLNWLTQYFIKKNYKNDAVLKYQKTLKDIAPDIVFNTSHIHNLIALDLLYAVKKLQLKTAAFMFSWDNLTSQGRIIPNYDYYFTWNDKIKIDLLRLYPQINKGSVFVTGTPQFDFHFNKQFIDTKERLYTALGISNEKKIVLYSTGMSYYCPKEHLIVQEVEKVLNKIDKDLQLVVRIYAKDDNTAYYQLRDKNPNICIPEHYWELNHLTPTIKDITLFNSLLHHCTIGINVASTVSLDLAIVNKPIINIAFNPPGVDIYPNDYKKIYEFDHYKPIVNSGAISLAKNQKDLEEQLRQYLECPSYKENERKKLVQDFFGDTLNNDNTSTFAIIFKSLLSK